VFGSISFAATLRCRKFVRDVPVSEQDLEIWNHLGAVMNWLLGSGGNSYRSY
jgi:hypothetical protein